MPETNRPTIEGFVDSLRNRDWYYSRKGGFFAFSENQKSEGQKRNQSGGIDQRQKARKRPDTASKFHKLEGHDKKQSAR